MAKARNIVSLTPNEAREIRELVAAGAKQIDLANQYCVDKSTISKIVKGSFTPNLPRLTPEIVEALKRWKAAAELGLSEDEYALYTGRAVAVCGMLNELLKRHDAV